MKKKNVIIILFLIFISNILSQKNDVMSYDSNIDSMMITEFGEGLVKNENLAIQLAEIYLTSIYGTNCLKRHLPLEANLIDDNWYIYGSIRKDIEGGIPIIKISKINGEILGYIHQK